MGVPEPSTASAAAVAGLAREVEGLRRDMTALAELPARVDELAGLVGQVVQDLAAGRGRSGPVAAPSWLDLPTDQDTARQVLAELVDWMSAVYMRYHDAVQSLPDCWLWHPELVEELLWLQHAWRAAYRDKSASVQLAADWHDRLRPGVVRRIRAASRGLCDLSTHKQSLPPLTAPVGGAVSLIAQWWTTARDQAAPPPEPEHLQAASEYYAQAHRSRHEGGAR